jgi:Fusaric acid resistance protein family
MPKNAGFREIIFSVNCFYRGHARAVHRLAPEPHESLVGTLRAGAVYRLLGTLIGGIAMLVIFPNLADSTELTAAAVILWVARGGAARPLSRRAALYPFAAAGRSHRVIALAAWDKTRHAGFHHGVEPDARRDAVPKLAHGVFRYGRKLEVLLDTGGRD